MLQAATRLVLQASPNLHSLRSCDVHPTLKNREAPAVRVEDPWEGAWPIVSDSSQWIGPYQSAWYSACMLYTDGTWWEKLLMGISGMPSSQDTT